MGDGVRSDTGGNGIATRQLAVLGVVVALVALAGCAGVLSDDAGEPADHAPDNSDVLVHLDMAVMEDDESQQLLNALAEEDASVEDQEDLLNDFEDETGLDLRESQEALLFADAEQAYMDPMAEEYLGFIVYSDWETDAVIEAIEEEEDTEYERTEYAGEEALFEPAEEPEWGQALYVGLLDEGKFVFGSEAAVKDSLDVAHGDADPVSGDVREAYDNSEDGHVTFAAAPPADAIPEGESTDVGGVTVSSEPFQNVDAVSAVYFTGDGTAGSEVQVYTSDEDSAQDIYDLVDGLTSTASGTIEDDDVADQIRAIEVEQDGSSVTVTYEGDVDSLVELIEKADV